jgi:hypothetical protein
MSHETFLCFCREVKLHGETTNFCTVDQVLVILTASRETNNLEGPNF